jgi:RNA polymerase sigma factor (sigma-70 family)
MDEDELELLRRFASGGDEKAFEALVERHAGLVRGVAQRRVSDPHLAEEVTQAVFLLLARKAGGIREALGGWLYKAAFLEAGNALRKSARYRRKLDLLRMETEISSPGADGESGWDEVRPHLDEAVAGLEPRSRNMLIMWFYERRSLREIAAATGKSEEASRKDISRSVQRLGDRLKRRGITATTAGLAALLSAQTLCAPPASAAVLAASVLAAAGPMAAAGAAGAAAGAAGSGPLVTFSQTLTTVMKASQTIKVTGLALLLAAVPTVYFQQKNSALESEVVSLRKALQEASAKAALNPAVRAVDRQAQAAAADPAKAKAAGGAAAEAKGPQIPAFMAETFLKQAKENASNDATRDLARMSLYLPDLTDDQKAKIQTLLEKRNKDRVEGFSKIMKSGLATKMMSDPKSLTDAEKAELQAMRPKDASPENDPLKEILSDDQFAKHLEVKEQKRVSDAESTASDSLKTLGQTVELNAEQKDSIFQAVAQYEMSRDANAGDRMPGPFGGGGQDEERDRIILEHLSPEQGALYEERRQEERQRREGFMKMMMGGGQPKPAETK